MSHDYDPNWDYPVCELSELVKSEAITEGEKTLLENVVERVKRELAPALGFPEIEVFFTEDGGMINSVGSEVVAVYCNGTSSRPVIGLDVALTRRVCEEEDLDFLEQINLSLAHELGHAYQETLGLDDGHEDGFDEDDAEQFGRNWADWGQIDLWLLNPELPRPVQVDPAQVITSDSLNAAILSESQEDAAAVLPGWLETPLASAERYAPWPRHLAGARELAAYVAEHASGEVDEEFVEEYFRDCQAILLKLPIRQVLIEAARADANISDPEKERKYLALPAQTMPPILLNDRGVVEDGHHRLRTALKRSEPHIWCYVAVDAAIDLKLSHVLAAVGDIVDVLEIVDAEDVKATVPARRPGRRP